MQKRIRIAVFGEGAAARSWAVALEPHADVSLIPEEASEAGAIVVAPGTPDPFGVAKNALARGIPVLYVAPGLWSPWQASLLDALSRRMGAFLRVAEPSQYQGGVRFLQRLTRGREPLWQLRYLRMTSLAGAGERIDELALDDLSTCQALIDLPPATVTATAAQRDEMGSLCALFINVSYPRDIVAQCTVRLAEPSLKRELVAVTRTRTVAIDRLDGCAPIEVAATGRDLASTPLRRSIVLPSGDPLAEEAHRFAQAVAARERSFGNSERWVRVAAIWWAARQSISFGGTIDVPAPDVMLTQRKTLPPPLRVIEGGGRATRASKRPQLTLVAG
jgi:hypothetical protein